MDETIQARLIEKYGEKIVNECIPLIAHAKFYNKRFSKGMSIEDIEICCQIKQANPDLDIIEHDQ